MATLEKIRSKSVLLVSIIFVALFLFIITIIDNPLGLFMDQTSVAKVDGMKIDYEQYQKKSQELREQNPQNEQADEQALQALISDALFNREVEKLGIAVTPNEVTEVLVGENAPRWVLNAFAQQFGGSPQDVLELIQNPDAAGLQPEQVQAITKQYKEFEEQLVQMLKGQKLMMLTSGSIAANKLDAKAAYEAGKTTYQLAAASKSIYSVQDSVTEAEIQKYYNAHKEEVNQREPLRYVKYATLAITPSAADRAAAMQVINETMAQLAETEGIEALQGNSAFITRRAEGDSAAVAAAGVQGLNAFVTEAAVGEARVIANNAYAAKPSVTIGRLLGRETKVNGAKVKQLLIDPAFNADSVLAKINAPGAVVDSIEGVANSAVQPVDFAQLPAQVVDSIKSATNKFILLQTGGGYSAAMKVESFDAPKPIYDYAVATYDIEPSRETLDQLNTRMRDFLIIATTADAFNQDNAAQQGLSVEDVLVSPSASGVGSLTDSKNILAWTMDAKKGEVSRLYTDNKNTYLAAAAVADIYKDGYVHASFPPYHQELENAALAEKNANTLIEQYKGKASTLGEYAGLMETRVDTIRNVNLSSPYYSGLGSLRGAKKGEVVGPMRWNGSVIVYQVIDTTDSEMPFDEKNGAAQYAGQLQQYILGQTGFDRLLLGNGKVENKVLKFTRQ